MRGAPEALITIFDFYPERLLKFCFPALSGSLSPVEF